MNVKEDVERDLLELVRMMPQTLRALKRRAPAGNVEDMREVAAAAGLGPRHLPIIVALGLDPELTVSEISRRIGLGVAATSLMVGELDRAGLVARRVDESDRRRTVVSMCEEHRVAAERLAVERLAPLRRGLERMGPETRAHFLAGWRLIAEEAEAAE